MDASVMSEEDLGIDSTYGKDMPPLLSKALRGLIAFVVFAMMTLTFVDVFFRYLFSAPIPGGFEIIQFLLAILIFTALPLVTSDEGHIVVSVFERFFTGRRGVVQRFAVQITCIGALILIAFLMWRQADTLQSSKQITGFLEWPIYPVAYVMCALSLIAAGLQIAMLWRLAKWQPDAGDGAPK